MHPKSGDQKGVSHHKVPQSAVFLGQKRLRDGKSTYIFFNIIFCPPTQNYHFRAPRKKFLCLISWERTQKGEPACFFFFSGGGGFGVRRGQLWATKSLVYCFFFVLARKDADANSPFFFLLLSFCGPNGSTKMCSEFSPKFSRILLCFLSWETETTEISHKKEKPCLFIAKSPDNSKEEIH